MGAGLIIIPLLILLYFPVFILSIKFYSKAKLLSKLENEKSNNPKSIKRLIVLLYIVAALFGGDAKFVNVISSTIFMDWYWFKSDLKRAVLGWDDLGVIFNYWMLILLVCLFVCFFAYILKKYNNANIYKYNLYNLAIFNLLLQPFIIVSTLGRLFGWEQMANQWLGL